MSGERKALIVASDRYEQDGLRNLLAPAADAEALAQVLSDPQIGDFVVHVVQNEPSHVIQGQVEDLFLESKRDDVLLLHFSCHGLKGDSGELFFAAVNTRPNRLGSTAVSADFVQRCMRASRSRSIVLLLDCCYGGAFAQGVTVRAAGDVNVLDSFPKERPGGGRGLAVITASTAMEYAFEGEHLTDDQHRRPSLFTAALTEGLATGDADRDEDGWVSLNELYEYVFDKVRERNPHQTPSRQVEMEGDLYLARSRRRRIQAAPIPADLQAAMTDPNMYTRLGAVSELQARLTGDNLAAAVGAFEGLDALRNDIRYIAGPAAAAVAEAAVRPDQTEVRFGQIERGSAPPHHQVRLLGPPIAWACTLRPSHGWLKARQTSEVIDVSIDTTQPGSLHGSLEVKGPTGRAVISVAADVVATGVAHPARPALGEQIPAAASPIDELETSPVVAAATSRSLVVEEPVVVEEPAATAEAAVPAARGAGGSVSPPTTGPAAPATKPSSVPPAEHPGAPDRLSQPAPPSRSARRSKTTRPSQPGSSSRPAPPSLLHRWVLGPDKPVARAAGAVTMTALLSLDAAGYFGNVVVFWRIAFVLAILGMVIAAAEMPPRWTTTFVHGLNAAYFVALSAVIVHLYASYFFPAGGLSPMLQYTLLAGTVVYGIGAIVVSVSVYRGDRHASSILSLIAIWLVVIGGVYLTLSAYNESVDDGRTGTFALLAAALASLLAAVALLSARARPAPKGPGA